MTLNSDVQKSNPGDRVQLLDVDATGIGGAMQYFVKGTSNDAPVVWKGNTYMPVEFEVEGFEMNGQGTLPRPKIRVSHINTAFLGLVRETGDLLGAIVTRWKTFTKYLDDGPQADPNAHFAPDVFKIDRKTGQNKIYIEWELAAAMDQEGKQLPGRQVLRPCTAAYRVWTGTEFDYTNAVCPYTGTDYFDRTGTECSQADDNCGKQISDCELRFPDQALPYYGFPGVARTRT